MSIPSRSTRYPGGRSPLLGAAASMAIFRRMALDGAFRRLVRQQDETVQQPHLKCARTPLEAP